MKYKILEHPADLKIQTFGKDLPEIFVNMALAVAGQQLGIDDPENFPKSDEQKEEIVVESADIELLLVDWLNEILYRSDASGKVYVDFEVTQFSESPPKIAARISGAPFAAPKEDIKAATYHGVEIKKSKGIWETTVLFDI